jgi:hypothetical protein
MSPYERLGVVALVIGTGSVCTVGTIYLRPAAGPTVAPAPIVAMVPAPIRTVSWFKAHRDELREKYVACKDNPGQGRTDPECDNVVEAKLAAGSDDLIKRYDDAMSK